MAPLVAPTSRPRIIYPESDGLPMAENDLQFNWIVTIKEGLDDLFRDNPDVYIAGDMFWYPVEGRPDIRIAPDAMVAFGRPKGIRRSYLQWIEGNIAPQVVFEVLSPGNRTAEMIRKFEFYRHYGVEEYYLYDPEPDRLELSGYLRQDDQLVEIGQMNGHLSPRLKVRFELLEDGLRILRPDGRPLLKYSELSQWRKEETERAELESQRANQAAAEVARLREKLRGLGHDPD